MKNQKQNQDGKKQLQLNRLIYLLPVYFFNTLSAFAKVQEKSETSTVMAKFSQAILLVAVFAVFVFVILYLYKKFIVNTNKPLQKPSLENSLESPSNMDDALRMFLDKTKPNQ